MQWINFFNKNLTLIHKYFFVLGKNWQGLRQSSTREWLMQSGLFDSIRWLYILIRSFSLYHLLMIYWLYSVQCYIFNNISKKYREKFIDSATMLKYLPIPHWRWHAQLVPRARSPQRLSFSTRCRDPPRGGPPDLDSCRFCSTYGESTIKRRECCTEHNQRLIHIDRLTNRLAVLQVFPKKSYIIVSAATWKKSCIIRF